MLVDHMTARPVTEAVEAARRIVAWDDAGRLADDEWLVERNESAIIAIARALLSTSAAVRGMREALQLFRDHYPRGINPWLDEAHSKARAALSEDLKCDHDWAAEDDKGHRCKRCGAVT